MSVLDHKIEKWLLVLVFKSFILPKFPQTFLVARWRSRFEVKSFQLVDCCCVVLTKLKSHCWSCSVKIQAWKIPCVCVRPQDREMAAFVSLHVVYIAKISTDLSRCVLAQSLGNTAIQAWKIPCVYVRPQDREMRLSLGRNEHQTIKIC